VKPLPEFLLRQLQGNSLIQSLLDPSTEHASAFDAERLSPTLISLMKDYQMEGVRFIIRRGGRGLIGDDMGEHHDIVY